MCKLVDLFPLGLYIGELSFHNEVKSKYYNEKLIPNKFSKVINSYSNPTLIHNDSRFELLFSSLKENLYEYISNLGIDYKKLSFHIIKSWSDILNPDSDDVSDINDNRYDQIFPSVSHWHPYSDISFIYYMNANETSDKLYIENCFANKNDFDALFQLSVHNCVVTEWNKYNSNIYVHCPKSGQVLLFPSKLNHYTKSFTKRVGKRITFAGDIAVTAKKDSNFWSPQLASNPYFWKEL